MIPRTLVVLAAVAAATPAPAQPFGGPRAVRFVPGPYGFVIGDPNNTGGGRQEIVPLGATGADTVFGRSSIGSNVSRPELAVPNGSGGGGSGGTR